MAGSFTVDTAALIQSARVIEEKTARYEAEILRIYSEISDLRTKFKGQASDSFHQQIEGYRNDFNELAKILKEYASFLPRAAGDYAKKDAELAAQVQRMPKGK